METKDELEQQRSEKFYLWRRERKDHIGSCRDPETGGPWVSLEIGFYSFLYCPRAEIFGMDG
jgi:hypothetical protein